MSYAVNGCGWYDWGSRSRSIIRRLLKPHPVSQSFAEFPSNQSVSYAVTSNTGISLHKCLRMRRQLCSRCICKMLWWLDDNANMITYTTLRDIRISREKSLMKLTQNWVNDQSLGGLRPIKYEPHQGRYFCYMLNRHHLGHSIGIYNVALLFSKVALS